MTQRSDEQITLLLPASGLQVTQWLDYTFNSHILTPTDGWSLNIGGEFVKKELKQQLVPGAEVILSLNGLDQCRGYVDSVEVNTDRSGGKTYRIDGRDVLGPVIDGHIDPRLQFKDSMTLEDFVKSIFEPYGFKNFVIDSDASRTLKTGLKRGKLKRPRALAKFRLRQLRPQANEGAFAFAARVAQRQGLWIWASPDGETLMLGEPDFEQEPSYKILRNRGSTNVLSGSLKFETAEQPTIIIADGIGGGAGFGHSRIRAKCVHPILGYDANGAMLPQVKAIFDKHADAVEVKLSAVDASNVAYRRGTANRVPFRPLYLHDDESKTLEQLTLFIQREMALRLQKAVTLTYNVEGHAYRDGGSYVPWAVDTIADVDDEELDVKGRMYLMNRTFRCGRSGGKETTLEFVIPGALKFT